mmetsp:Transcript_14843/g.33504  ORF Transcript_14843/g.33504 Transcript_14843/m.33504 type:complete len:82 (+) Transcript_14843:204-449(+)
MSQASITLFRCLLREAKKVDNYNFRLYAIRRTRIGFESNKNLSGKDAELALQEGKEQLEILRRQVVLGNLYPSEPSVMEAA